MRHLVTSLTVLAICTVSCVPNVSLGTTTPLIRPSPTAGRAATPAPTPSPSSRQTTGPSEQRCGDGVCDGPEDSQNCPKDCGGATAKAGPVATAPLPQNPEARPASEPDTYWVTNPTSGVELYTTVMRPDDWDGEPLPALVVIPGGDDDSSGIAENGIGPKAVTDGYAVIAFDPDGRGRSSGDEDYNGFTHQDGLAAVVRFAAGLPEVDAERNGQPLLSYLIQEKSAMVDAHAHPIKATTTPT